MSSRSSAPNPAGIPSQIAQFEIVRRLGAGGMAEVFLAKKRGAEGTYKVVVVKRILPAYTTSRRFRSMFVDEAQLATRLNHPNVVQVYEFSNEGDEGHILAMEYVEGCDLGQLMSAAKAKGRAHPAVGRRVDHRRGREGPALRAREARRGRRAARHRPSRRVAAERPALVRGRREDRRLRHRERAPLRRGGGRPQGQVRVHVARAGARREGRSAQRPLRARRHPLGVPHRAPAARRPRRRGAARHRALRATSSRRARTCATSPRSSRRS